MSKRLTYYVFDKAHAVLPVRRIDMVTDESAALARIPAGYTVAAEAPGRRMVRRPNGSLAFVIAQADRRLPVAAELALRADVEAAWC